MRAAIVLRVLTVVWLCGSVAAQEAVEPRSQRPRGPAGEWIVTLDFPDLNVRETLELTFRPGVGLDPNGRLRRGYLAVRKRPDLGSNKSTIYFLRLVDRTIKMSVDRDEMCEVVFESNDSFFGRCSMIGITGKLTARRSPTTPE